VHWRRGIQAAQCYAKEHQDLRVPYGYRSEASWRIVKFVRHYAVTNSVRSYSDKPHGRPRWTVSTPARRSTVTSLANCSDAVITPATARSFHCR
jgi:hypothetical protein